MQVGLIDCGAGNITSVHNALVHLGATPRLVHGPRDFAGLSHLVLPGVGAFKRFMDRLCDHRLVDSLRRAVADGTALLGICVGMQVLADCGYEFERCAGLGLIGGEVRKLEVNGRGERLPHIGWSEVAADRNCPLFAGLGEPVFYFLHSYNFSPADPDHCKATCDYGSGVTACVQSGTLFGVQFHPEKSQHDGLRVLRNFMEFAP